MLVLLQDISLHHELIHVCHITGPAGLHSHLLPIQPRLKHVPKRPFTYLLPNLHVTVGQGPLVVFWDGLEDLGLRGFCDGSASLHVVVQQRADGGEGLGLKSEHLVPILLKGGGLEGGVSQSESEIIDRVRGRIEREIERDLEMVREEI